MDSTASKARVRKSVDALTKTELDQLVRAWAGIQQLSPEERNSFFKIGGYHGEPFRGAGWGANAYWGGYCNHGNVLFPTWHRVYLLELEHALRSIEGCADVTLPYWDEVSKETFGLPTVFTTPRYEFDDGKSIDNPLYSYTLRRDIVDHRSPIPDANYSKPAGYRTVRYPLSGLVGTEADRAKTEEHNRPYLADPDTATSLLNQNVHTWLTDHPVIGGKPIARLGMVRQQYADCLKAPNYTVFSNTTSRTEWNDHHSPRVVSLESPHNAIHLAIGGFDVPNNPSFSPIPGANGDMGENETASFDPIFYFHHCFIDLVFWRWQEKHDATKKLEIIHGYPGTNSVDSQGPTPGVAPNAWLDENSPLDPFRKADGSPWRTRDCADIHALGYDYENTSVNELDTEAGDRVSTDTGAVIQVSGIDRTKIKGSFLISAFATVGGTRHHLGTEAVLSRWHVEGCANCQNHLLSSATFAVPEELLDANGVLTDRGTTLEAGITTHTEAATETLQALIPGDAGALRTVSSSDTEARFYAEVRTGPSRR